MLSLAKLKAENRQNVWYTLLCNGNHIIYGIILNIFGSTLIDLGYIYSVSVDTMAYLPLAFYSGYMFGSLTGWIYNRLNRQVTVSIFFSVAAITAALTPYYHYFPLLLACIFVCGLGAGCWISSSGAWLVEMWPVGNSSVLQFYQFMYGSGAVLSPLLVTPFVYGKIEFDEQTNRTITADDRIRSLATPFAICGLAGLSVPLILLLLFFVSPYRKICKSVPSSIGMSERACEANESLNNHNNNNNPNNESNNDENNRKQTSSSTTKIPYRIIKLAMCGLALASIVTAEFGWLSFASTMFQNLPIALSAASGARMMAIFYATYTVGPLVTGFVALKLSPDVILSYHFVIMSTALTILYVGRDNLAIIYAANGALGFGNSAMWSAMYAFTERHLCLSDRICSTFSFLTGIISLIIPIVLGQTFQRFPLTLFLLEASLIAFCLAMFAIVRFWIWLDRRAKK